MLTKADPRDDRAPVLPVLSPIKFFWTMIAGKASAFAALAPCCSASS
jgi:hypothetical protein